MITSEEKIAAVERYEKGKEPATVIARDMGVGVNTFRLWRRKYLRGEKLRAAGGVRPHYHGFDEEDIKWFVHFKNRGWKMSDIAEKIERSVNTAYVIQREADARGLIDWSKARKKGQRDEL